MEESNEYCVGPLGFEEEYEFDAPQFYDFTRRECDSEIQELQRWFEVSRGYSPSPFIVRLNLEEVLSHKAALPPKSLEAKSTNNTKPVSKDSDGCRGQGVSKGKKHGMQDNAKSKADKKVFHSKNSRFMKPTASHLAKQKIVHDNHSSHICNRFQKISVKVVVKGLQSPTRFDSLETKRQKIETGYSRKVAQLKHHFSPRHKSTKKVTIPKEPELETLLRAQRRGSKSSCASCESEKQKQKPVLPLNKKVGIATLQSPSVPQPKKSSPIQLQLQECRSSASDMEIGSPPTEQLNELSLRADDFPRLDSGSQGHTPPLPI